MADDTDANGGIGSAGAPTGPVACPVPRDKPVIEGHAEEIAVINPQGASAAQGSGDVPVEEPFVAFPSPPEAEVVPAEPVPDFTPSQNSIYPPPRPVLWPFTAAIVVGVLLAVGGAFALHRFDRMPANLASLGRRVAVLEHRPNSIEASSVVEAGLATRIAALEAASGDTQATIAGWRTDLDKLAAQRAAPNPAPDLAPLEARLSALEQKLAALDTQIIGFAKRLNAENGQVRASENVSESVAARADSEAIAILAANLLRKVDSGAPYATDLAALANRGLDKTKLAPLEPAAASGVATPAALAKQFFDLSPAILATEPQRNENGFFDHLVKGAERLVRVQKVGDASGDDLSSRVARIKASLDASAVETAYQEWNALPDAAKAKSESFGDAAKARIDAVAAARSIDAEAVVALGKARS